MESETSVVEFSETSSVGVSSEERRRSKAERRIRHPRRGAHHLAAKLRASRKRPHAAPKFFLPHKRVRKDAFIPPTKFLLGGNISDPLNLNSLQDEDVNRAMNAVTPKSSPLPTPPRHRAKVDVIIPPDLRDPLNLLQPLTDDEYEKQLERRSKRTRKRTKPPALPPAPPISPPSPEARYKEAKRTRRLDSMDKIVSPVVPQPGAWKHTRQPKPRDRPPATSPPHPPGPPGPPGPAFKTKNQRYQYGNYDRYYGYRGVGAGGRDVRLEVLQQYRHVFAHKDVLDVGCNVGYVTIAVARLLGARSVTGIDIDNTLIERAKSNLQAFISVPEDCPSAGAAVCEQCPAADAQCSAAAAQCPVADAQGPTAAVQCPVAAADAQFPAADAQCPAVQCPASAVQCPASAVQCPASAVQCPAVAAQCEQCPAAACACTPARITHKKGKRRKKNRKGSQHNDFYFPASFSTLYGPLPGVALPAPAPPPPATQQPPAFPHNVIFKQGNYVSREESAESGGGLYDVVLCLSTTKWLHLNFGDAGLKLAFRRMFAELRPGGKLVLEPQSWSSYARRKTLTERIYNNYKSLELLPHKFRDYLLSPEVGFSRCCVMGVPRHRSKGFRRPLHLYVKGDFTPSGARWSDAYAPPSSHHAPDAPPPRRTVYAPCAPRTPHPAPPSPPPAASPPAQHLACTPTH